MGRRSMKAESGRLVCRPADAGAPSLGGYVGLKMDTETILRLLFLQTPSCISASRL